MDPALLSIFVLLQLVLAPLLYPVGYIVQAVAVLSSGWRRFSLGEMELCLLETLALVCLLCNMVLEDNITIAGYATRIGILLFRLYQSPRLQHLSMQILEPVTSCFLLVELIASPHLYPVGYLAQLGLILFLALSNSLQVLSLLLTSNRKQFQKQFQVRSTQAVDNLSSASSSKFASPMRSFNVTGRSRSHSNNSEGKSPMTKSMPVKRKVAKSKSTTLLVFAKWLLRQLYAMVIVPRRSSLSPSHQQRNAANETLHGASNSTATAAAESDPDRIFLSGARNCDRLQEQEDHVVTEQDEEGEVDDEVDLEPAEDELMLCKICFEDQVTTAFVSCGHVCCRKCSDTLTHERSRMVCPFCQSSIHHKIDIFFP
jgi:hypothetical protein